MNIDPTIITDPDRMLEAVQAAYQATGYKPMREGWVDLNQAGMVCPLTAIYCQQNNTKVEDILREARHSVYESEIRDGADEDHEPDMDNVAEEFGGIVEVWAKSIFGNATHSFLSGYDGSSYDLHGFTAAHACGQNIARFLFPELAEEEAQ